MVEKIRNTGNINWYDDNERRVHHRKRLRKRIRDEIRINNKVESEIIEKIRNQSEIRKDKIEEVKKKINKGFYNKKIITEELANILLGKIK